MVASERDGGGVGPAAGPVALALPLVPPPFLRAFGA